MTLTRDQIQLAFAMMGEMLARDRLHGEIAVFGGTAIMLQMDYRLSTDDVDCVVTGGHGPVMKAMIAVQGKLGLPSGWLNESVSVYASRHQTETDFFPFGTYPARGRPGLTVSLARPEYLLAMKIEALGRQHPKDLEDVELLASSLGIDSMDRLLEARERYFRDKEPSPEVTFGLRHLVERLKKGKADEPQIP